MGVVNSGVSLRVSEVELRDELLLDNCSLLTLLKLEVRWRKDSINSVGSLCSSRGVSCRCLCVWSLNKTCDNGMPNAWGVVSVCGGRTRQGDFQFISLTTSQLCDVELPFRCVSHASIIHIFYPFLELFNKYC